MQGGKPETRDAKSLGTEVVTQTCIGGNIFFVATVVEWALAEYTSKFTKLGTQQACVLLKERLPGWMVSQSQASGMSPWSEKTLNSRLQNNSHLNYVIVE